jgi:hypothetical protein
MLDDKISDELERIWIKALMGMIGHYPAGTEENHEKDQE